MARRTEGDPTTAAPATPDVATATPAAIRAERMPIGIKYALGVAGAVAILGVAGTGSYALYETGRHANDAKKIESSQAPRTTTETTGQAAGAADPKPQGVDVSTTLTTPTTVFEQTTTSTTAVEQSNGLEMGGVGVKIPVPSVISGDMVREVRDGGKNKLFTEGQWFHPVYDIGAETAANDYRGIGPWYPVAFANIDANAAQLTTHGNVGELVISTKNGGKVMIAVMQLDKHQTDGAWGTDPNTGKFMQNRQWAMQYNFHSLQPNQEIFVVDPDTGNQLTWPDGSPVIYRANEQGIAAFAIPKTHGNDVRVGFVFTVPAQDSGVQASEIKFERGPNDRPGKTGENPLPETILKPMVSEK